MCIDAIRLFDFAHRTAESAPGKAPTAAAVTPAIPVRDPSTEEETEPEQGTEWTGHRKDVIHRGQSQKAGRSASCQSLHEGTMSAAPDFEPAAYPDDTATSPFASVKQ